MAEVATKAACVMHCRSCRSFVLSGLLFLLFMASIAVAVALLVVCFTSRSAFVVVGLVHSAWCRRSSSSSTPAAPKLVCTVVEAGASKLQSL